MAPEGVSAGGVRARGLAKWFGGVCAVRGADLTLPDAGVCGLLGPNGAGKTTIIRMVAGVLPPDEGELTVLGLDPRRAGAQVRSVVGYLPESAPLYPELTVEEYLRFRGGIAGLSAADARLAARSWSERCDVARFAHRCCGTLSKGMQQRVGVAATLLADPRIVILDEPSVGLDPGQSLAFRGLVRELGSTRLVILSSHLLSEVESVCSELAIVAGGRVVAHESIDRFRARAAQDGRMFAEIDRALAGDPALAQLFGECAEQRLEDGWHRIEFRGAAGDDPRARIAGDLSARGVRLRALGVASASLESVFVGLVHAAAADTATSDTATSGTAGGGR